MLLAGTETSAMSILWPLYLLGRNAPIQEKVHAELDEKIKVRGTENPNETGQATLSPPLSSSEIKKNLPFTSASFYEAIRFSTPVTLPFPRRAEVDVELENFLIPKDSFILQNLWGANHDSRLWKNPNSFDPSNFLDENTKQLINLENSIPYSVGVFSLISFEMCLIFRKFVDCVCCGLLWIVKFVTFCGSHQNLITHLLAICTYRSPIVSCSSPIWTFVDDEFCGVDSSLQDWSPTRWKWSLLQSAPDGPIEGLYRAATTCCSIPIESTLLTRE